MTETIPLARRNEDHLRPDTLEERKRAAAVGPVVRRHEHAGAGWRARREEGAVPLGLEVARQENRRPGWRHGGQDQAPIVEGPLPVLVARMEDRKEKPRAQRALAAL